ncbi:hypothetical protein Mal33_03530 [Rosistilla oblonga]|uniref:Probable membrane transporter protein n=2 Tax=Rosistilla oblonga TaxID=2527990 RepID=A0A518IMT3_9BACT|nr:hypothetical protein Mal33_03530 [Rosistilla oblonga]
MKESIYEMQQLAWYVVLIAAGFIAGIINTIAGGGSFLTLPALMLFGLDPKIANGTNRVAVLFSSASAVATFNKHGYLNRSLALELTIPTLAGVPVGALLAIYLPSGIFEAIFGVIFLCMAVLIAMNPKRLIETRQASDRSRWVTSPLFFAIGIYVGFIQAGMGILLLMAMSLLNTGDLLASNAIKNLIGFLVTLAAVGLFAVYGYIEWLPGLAMAMGNVVGGVVGAKLAIKKGNRLIFVFLIVVMTASGVKMIWSSLS